MTNIWSLQRKCKNITKHQKAIKAGKNYRKNRQDGERLIKHLEGCKYNLKEKIQILRDKKKHGGK